jgi:hypothetical protein
MAAPGRIPGRSDRGGRLGKTRAAVKVGLQLIGITRFADATLEVSAFGNLKVLVEDVSVDLGRGVENDGHRTNAAFDAAVNIDPFGRHVTNYGTFWADDHLLARDVSVDIALDLETVLGNDGDALAKDRQVRADHRSSYRGGRSERRQGGQAGRQSGPRARRHRVLRNLFLR